MAQSSSDAVGEDAQTKHSDEEYAGGMGHIAMHKMNLLHLDQNTATLQQLKPYPISVLLGLHSANQEEDVSLKR